METKKTKKTNLKFIGLILILSFLGCNTNKKIFDYGKIENGKYHNTFFELEITLPPDWAIRTQEQLQNLTEKGKKMIVGDDKNMKAIVDAVDIENAVLLGISKYEVGTVVDFNPSLILSVENLKGSPGIKTGSDYLFHCRKLIKQSHFQYDYIDEEFRKEVINNQDFYLMNTSVNYLELTVKQTYYATIRNGFCLILNISFIDDEQKRDLDRIVKSIKFDK